MNSKDNIFSCFENCKKTKALKESKLCNGRFKIIDGKPFFGCEEALESYSGDDKNYLTCSLVDMGVNNCCKFCPLECSKSENDIVKKTMNAKKNFSSTLEGLKPLLNNSNIDISILNGAMNSLSNIKNTNNSSEIEEVVNITNYAKKILANITSGKSIDLTEFKIIKERIEKKYKKEK